METGATGEGAGVRIGVAEHATAGQGVAMPSADISEPGSVDTMGRLADAAASRAASGEAVTIVACPPSDEPEAALARALTQAAEAGQWAVVAQLARELEARRLARSGNVVALPTPSSRRGR